MSFVAYAPVVCVLDNHLLLAPGISGYIQYVRYLFKGISVSKEEMSMFTWPVTQKPRAVCILHSSCPFP